jgi:hypothetical protein
MLPKWQRRQIAQLGGLCVTMELLARRDRGSSTLSRSASSSSYPACFIWV